MKDNNKLPLEGHISITRPLGFGSEYITIALEDRNSHISFVEVRVPLAEFAKALTGMHTTMTFKTRGLENVGKVMEQKELSFKLPAGVKDNKAVAREMAQGLADEGWTADLYFNSQSSFKYDYDTKTYTAYTRQYRYVEPKENK